MDKFIIKKGSTPKKTSIDSFTTPPSSPQSSVSGNKRKINDETTVNIMTTI